MSNSQDCRDRATRTRPRATRPDEPKVDVGIEGYGPVGGDQKLRLRLDAVDPGLRWRHRDDDDGKDAEEKIGKANPNGRSVSHLSTYIRQEGER